MSMFQRKRFVNRVFNRSVVYSTIPNMVVDFWQDFEFVTLNTTNLAANDHNAGGTWAITDTGGALSTSALGAKNTISNINGNPSNSTLGLQWDSSISNAARLDYTFASPPNANPISCSAWVYVPSTGSDGSIQLFYFFDVMKIRAIRASGVYTITTTTSSNSVTVSPDAWYWITIRVQRNSTCTLNVYNATGTLVGTTSETGLNNNLQFMIMGHENAHNWPSGMFYFDNWVVDYTTATFPLGP